MLCRPLKISAHHSIAFFDHRYMASSTHRHPGRSLHITTNAGTNVVMCSFSTSERVFEVALERWIRRHIIWPKTLYCGGCFFTSLHSRAEAEDTSRTPPPPRGGRGLLFARDVDESAEISLLIFPPMSQTEVPQKATWFVNIIALILSESRQHCYIFLLDLKITKNGWSKDRAVLDRHDQVCMVWSGDRTYWEGCQVWQSSCQCDWKWVNVKYILNLLLVHDPEILRIHQCAVVRLPHETINMTWGMPSFS